MPYPWCCPHPSYAISLVSHVSTITTRNNEDIQSIFGANVHHVPRLCLQDISYAPYIMGQKPYFHIFDFFSEIACRWHFIFMPEDSLNLGQHNLKNYSETPPTVILCN